jgi:beta-barrel assembly-enhancing protease
MKRARLISLIALATFAAPLSGQVPADFPDLPPGMVAPNRPIDLPQVPVVLPSLVRELPVSTGHSLKKFERKYDLQAIGHRRVTGWLNYISPSEELALGKGSAKEVDAAAHFVTDPLITEYVNRIAENIVRASDMKAPFTVKVIDSDRVNAFSLPGGFLYLNTGLLMMVDDEAELAGVIGHEVAHVAARHSTRQISRGIWISSAFESAMPKRGWGRVVGRLAETVAEDLLALKFSRGFEEEADLLGMQYLYAAGYDLGAYPIMLEKMRQREGTAPTVLDRMLSTHPLTQDRIKRCQRLISDYFPDNEIYQLTTSEFEDVKVRIANLHNNRVYQGDEDEERPPVLRRRSTYR